jgi:cytochrome c biogenesis protein CcmG/thiol:disulfide interchange protein DsbE
MSNQVCLEYNEVERQMEKRTDLSKVITVVILFLASIGIMWAVFNFNKEEAVKLELGAPAPNFTLKTLDGQSASLADYKGKVVLLNFWASWCEPCREEMPFLQKAYETYKDQGLVVLGVNLKENNVSIKGFADNYKLTFPILMDVDNSVAVDLYKVKPIPTSFFIDRDGNLVQKADFPMTYEYIENTVKPLLDAGR